MSEAHVVIIGAGLAGLSCGLQLARRKIRFEILEAADRPGGRVQTDDVDGFQLDRGFQVLLTAYPETSRTLRYDDLQLGHFVAGAQVRVGSRFYSVADPLRHPASIGASLAAPIGSLADKLRILKLRNHVCGGTLVDLLSRPEMATDDDLRKLGFSEAMINRFFRPFLGGIFLESDLVTSSRKFEFVFRMFAKGTAALPARGMRAIPEWLAEKLPPGSLRLNTEVQRIDGTSVHLEGRESIKATHVVVATDQPTAAKLLPLPVLSLKACSTTCFYFDAPASPVRGPWLVLNGEGRGVINNLCVPSQVCPHYAPAHRSLVSVSVLNDRGMSGEELHASVLVELRSWFGEQVLAWRHLRTYPIDYAVPLQTAGSVRVDQDIRVDERTYVCGDYTDVASIQGAMMSGRDVANRIEGY